MAASSGLRIKETDQAWWMKMNPKTGSGDWEKADVFWGYNPFSCLARWLKQSVSKIRLITAFKSNKNYVLHTSVQKSHLAVNHPPQHAASHSHPLPQRSCSLPSQHSRVLHQIYAQQQKQVTGIAPGFGFEQLDLKGDKNIMVWGCFSTSLCCFPQQQTNQMLSVRLQRSCDRGVDAHWSHLEKGCLIKEKKTTCY